MPAPAALSTLAYVHVWTGNLNVTGKATNVATTKKQPTAPSTRGTAANTRKKK